MFLLIIIDGWVATPVTKNYFNFLSNRGTWTDNCKVAYPPLTEPSIAAMLHGVEATYLNVYFDDQKDYGNWTGYLTWTKSLFQLLAEHNKASAICGGWKGLANEIIRPGWAADFTRANPESNVDDQTVEIGCRILRRREHDLVVVYFEEADHIGHHVGLGRAYNRVLRSIAAKIQQLVQCCYPDDGILINSDHGRQISDDGKGHFEYTSLTTVVPLYFYSGNDSNHENLELNPTVAVVDVTPTILKYFNIAIPTWVRGKPL